MDQFQKSDLAQRVAASIRQSLAGGEAGSFMPSLRSIALNLGVSVPSVAKAFSILEGEGVLKSCGERRRWKLSDASAAGPAQAERIPAGPYRIRRLLYVTSLPMNQWLNHSMEVYADLVSVMGSCGWEVIHRVIGFHEARAPRKSWDDLVRQEAPDAMVALTGNPVLARWAVGQPVRMLFLGGTCGPHSLPMVAVGMAGPTEELIQRLADLGHRHMVMPLCGRSSGFAEKIRVAVKSAVESRAATGTVVHLLETPYSTPEVLYDSLRKHWRHHRPDAVILLDWREFVTVTSFFRDSGISIPRDISVALLSRDSSMDWHLPRLAHYEFSPMKLAKAVARWTLNDNEQSPSTARISMRAQWRDGGSVSERR